ncbi:MAG: tetratricopeptide repeat protein [Pedosphaera sp.]|nr:tetratricopeptide repeat protein [Pedosphaera sp.]
MKTNSKAGRLARFGWWHGVAAVLGMYFLGLPMQRVFAADAVEKTLIEQAMAAWQRGDAPEAMKLSQRLVSDSPEYPAGWLLRASLFDALGQPLAVATNLSQLIRLEPGNARHYEKRGVKFFQAGKVPEALIDFDRVNELAPGLAPQNWQRGIALYYAGRFADGRKQFELHQTVNSQDVENAVWHFLCTAREQGVSVAQSKLIAISGDGRVPMTEVHRLFAGRATAADVLIAAEAVKGTDVEKRQPRFYAQLYLGLYYEAVGDLGKARDHIEKSLRLALSGDYMGDVAKVHAQLRGWSGKGK